MNKVSGSDINYLNVVKIAISNFRHSLDSLSKGLFRKDSKKDLISSENIISSFDDIWFRALSDETLRLLSSLQRAKYENVDEVIEELKIQNQEVAKIAKDLDELLLQFISNIADQDSKIDLKETRSAKTERVINRIMDFRKFDESLGKILQSANDILPLEKQLSGSDSETASDSEVRSDSQATFSSQEDEIMPTKRSISWDNLDADKAEEKLLKAKINEAKNKVRDDLMSDFARAKSEPDVGKRVEKYKNCLARAVDFTDKYFEDSILLEVAKAMSSDKIAVEVFTYRDNSAESVKPVDPASPKLLDIAKSIFGFGNKSDSDIDVSQKQPEKTLFHKVLTSLDPHSQFLLISSMPKQNLRQLFLMLESEKEMEPKKQPEYQEIKEIIKAVESKQQDGVRKSLNEAVNLRSEARKDALAICLNDARKLADLYDNPVILIEVAKVIFEMKGGNLITSDQALIFRNCPLSEIFKFISDDDSKQKLISEVPTDLLHLFVTDPENNGIKDLMEKESLSRREQEKSHVLEHLSDKLQEADKKSGQDKITTLTECVADIAKFVATYGYTQMVVNSLLLMERMITPDEQAAILSAPIGDKTLFHKIIASTKTNEHRELFSIISKASIDQLLPLVHSKSPEDKVIKDLLKEEQAKRDQEEKKELEAKKQQEKEAIRQKITAEKEEKRRQQEEARQKILAEEEKRAKQRKEKKQLQIKTEQQKETDSKIIRDGFHEVSSAVGNKKWEVAEKYLNLAVDFANKYGQSNLFDGVIKSMEAFNDSDKRLALKRGLDVQKSTIMFDWMLKNGKLQSALEFINLLLDDKKVIILSKKDVDGKTIFHKFAELGQLESLTKSIEIIPVNKRFDILNLQDKEGKTALHYAAQRKNGIISSNGRQVTSVLLENGGDANICDKEGKTPLHYAAKKGRAKTVDRMLVIRRNSTVTVVDMKDNQGKTALHLAAENNHRTSAAILLKGGADPYLADKQNKSVLEYGLEKGRKFFGLMVEKARPEYKFNQNQKPEVAANGFLSLMKAAIKSKIPNSMLKFLTKEKKFDLGVTDQDNNNVLHLALLDGDDKMAALLLKHGSRSFITKRNTDGKTARDIAIASDNPLIVKIFNKTALTTGENLSHLALKVKSETESDRKDFEKNYHMASNILVQLHESITILKDRSNYKGADEHLKQKMFGGGLFYLGHYLAFNDPVKNKQLHDLVGTVYRDGQMVTPEIFQAAIEDDNKRGKIINFVEKFSEEFEIKARKYGLAKEMKNQLFEAAKEIGKAGDDLSKLEFNSDSNRENIDRSAIFNHFSVKNEEGKIILSYNKIDHHLKERSLTLYQITIDPQKDEVMVSKNGKEETMSFVDLSKLVTNLKKFKDNLPEMLTTFHEVAKRKQNEEDKPSKDTHTDDEHVLHHTHPKLKDDFTVDREMNVDKPTEV
jgi:ankyrin repeat protein